MSGQIYEGYYFGGFLAHLNRIRYKNINQCKNSAGDDILTRYWPATDDINSVLAMVPGWTMRTTPQVSQVSK